MWLVTTGRFTESNADVEMPGGDDMADGGQFVLVPPITGNRLKW